MEQIFKISEDNKPEITNSVTIGVIQRPKIKSIHIELRLDGDFKEETVSKLKALMQQIINESGVRKTSDCNCKCGVTTHSRGETKWCKFDDIDTSETPEHC